MDDSGLFFRNGKELFFLCSAWVENISISIEFLGHTQRETISIQNNIAIAVNPITVGNFAFRFNCTPVGRTSDSMTVLA